MADTSGNAEQRAALEQFMKIDNDITAVEVRVASELEQPAVQAFAASSRGVRNADRLSRRLHGRVASWLTDLGKP